MNVNLYLDKNVIDEMVQQPSSKYNYLQHHFLSKNSVLYGTYTYACNDNIFILEFVQICIYCIA